MSDKQNNLNKNDENIQFDKATNSDQQKSDKPPINIGTASLKRLSPLQPRISALSDKSSDKPIDSSESVIEDKPATLKLSDKSSDNPTDSSESVVEDKPVTEKFSDQTNDNPLVLSN